MMPYGDRCYFALLRETEDRLFKPENARQYVKITVNYSNKKSSRINFIAIISDIAIENDRGLFFYGEWRKKINIGVDEVE